MTMIRSFTPTPKRAGELGIHSLDHISLAVPRMDQAASFYETFGLETRSSGNLLDLSCTDSAHTWVRLIEGPNKKLQYLSFAAYEEDVLGLKNKIEAAGVKLHDPPLGFDTASLWFCDPDGIRIELKVAEKTSPNQKMSFEMESAPGAQRGAPYRRQRGVVRPRRMAHVLIFTTDVLRAIDFYGRTLGLRLSDQTRDGIAFLHGIHGSDHHLIAFAKSKAPGFHHCSWDVPSVNDVGLGAMQMADKGYSAGWGLGRHVLGSNYFHYVRDPWGSYCEYSSDIDYIPVDCDWDAADHRPEDSFYLWGPEAPKDFTTNYEAGIPPVVGTE